ncbi:MAG: TonB-dependent receptor, partial [Burkholderiaceae bacterium]
MLIVHSNLLCATARTLSVISFLSVACDVSAQTTSTDTMLPPVVVTASRIEQPQTDALPHTTVITAEDIRNNPVTDLPSLLRREAGVQLTQTGGPGQLTSLFMRGAQPGEVLILIDGVPVRRQGFSPLPALEHILPEQIDHIEIVRGNVSAIYGTSAIGGVIQIFTKQGSGPAAFNLSTEIGSRGT